MVRRSTSAGETLTSSISPRQAGSLRTFLDYIRGDCLTVLCYHRIGRLNPKRFEGFLPNFSATPEEFKQQMRLVKALFRPVSLDMVWNFVREGRPLPKRSLLVTFDDGYRDNGSVAWPIMRELGIPGVVFLTTDHIGTSKPFLCDFVAYCFHRTEEVAVDDPQIGVKSLRSDSDRHAAAAAWVEASKRLPARDRWSAAETLADRLRVKPPAEAFTDLCLTWEEVRRLEQEGLAFGGHTQSHPILTRQTLAEARREILGCQERLLSELGHPALSFAYPNGSRMDYAPEHERVVESCGFHLAFTLEHGPASFNEVRERPSAIRRIYVGSKDSRMRLTAKLLGLSRFGGRVRRRPNSSPAVTAWSSSAEP